MHAHVHRLRARLGPPLDARREPTGERQGEPPLTEGRSHVLEDERPLRHGEPEPALRGPYGLHKELTSAPLGGRERLIAEAPNPPLPMDRALHLEHHRDGLRGLWHAEEGRDDASEKALAAADAKDAARALAAPVEALHGERERAPRGAEEGRVELRGGLQHRPVIRSVTSGGRGVHRISPQGDAALATPSPKTWERPVCAVATGL